MTRGGLPHSDIPGSKLVCSSPGLFAACHVLHRLLAPRHSPYTLSSLTIKLKTDAHQSFAYQLVATASFETLRVFVVGKNYRVQNIQLSKIRLAGLCRQSVNVGHRRSATCAALERSVPTSVQETPEGIVTSPKLFQRAASHVFRRLAFLAGRSRLKLFRPA